MHSKTVLAVDLGAESGRVMAVHFDGSGLTLEELHRFSNGAVEIRGTLYWDFLRLWSEIQLGIEKGKAHQPSSIGVDTWGVDFGLLDKDGQLLGNPVCYRDGRTEGMMELAFGRTPKEQIFSRTGIQFMRINTLYQLLSLVEAGSVQLEAARTLLMAPDLINYWLTGEKVSEYTIASTTQMLDAQTRTWATDLLAALDVPTHILPDVVEPGTRIGTYERIPVIAPACHDTGSAVAATPAETVDFGYISSGTWSLVGLESKEPFLGPDALAVNVTNEGGVDGQIRLLQNTTGLWLVQQCRATWQKAGREYSYAQLVELAEAAPALRSFINPNRGEFIVPGDYPTLVRDLCAESGQPVPADEGSIIRVILESLAMEYRVSFEQLERLTGKNVEMIHIFGGGSRNQLLNQMTADATGRPVVAGPVEATVLGNALVQLISIGEVNSLQEARQIVARSEQLKHFEPQRTAVWDDAFRQYQAIKQVSV